VHVDRPVTKTAESFHVREREGGDELKQREGTKAEAGALKSEASSERNPVLTT
jgi:hypothetical protein